jgi:hypothetical protein
MRVDGGCHCGKLSFEADINLRLGTVRQRAALAPQSQVWCRSALPWVMDLGAIKQHPKQSM